MLCQTNVISLRALDYLVTNYAKKYNVVCRRTDGVLFNIYHSYKVALAHYRRRNFDVFRRRKRIFVAFRGELHETTVGQCNFLHWAHLNGVTAYALSNGDIEQDMNIAASAHKAEKRRHQALGLKWRRKELSSAPSARCSVYRVDTCVHFLPPPTLSDSQPVRGGQAACGARDL